MNQPPRKLVPTLNGMGYMITALDEVSAAFVGHAATAPKPVIDIGAAFGVATLAALNAGAEVIANDLEPRHLEQLSEKVAKEARGRLTLRPGSFPDDVEIEEESLSAALLARVMQFFDGPQVERTANWLFAALAPGGKVFIVADQSVFLEQPELRSQFEKQKSAGKSWPGVISDVGALWPSRPSQIPDQIHILDAETLSQTFTNAGFIIDRADVFSRDVEPEHPRSRPRQSVCLIATKP